jgi:hypothetical protein
MSYIGASNVSSSHGNVVVRSRNLTSIFGGIPLSAYFKAYSQIPMSVWLQLGFALLVRMLVIWTLMSLLLLLYRRTNKPVISFIAELYASSFGFSLCLFGIIYFPTITGAFVTLAMVGWALVTLSQVVEAEDPMDAEV